MTQARRLPSILWMLFWIAAASSVWALAVMERALELPESPLRAWLIALSLAVIASAAGWAGLRLRNNRWRYLAPLVLIVVVSREGRSRALRLQYEATPPTKSVGPAQSLFHPITTTDITLRYYSLTASQLAAERLRLVLLSDLHVSPTLPTAYYDHVFDLVAAEGADLILLAGDYVSEPQNIALMTRVFARDWPARVGTFAVLGNHDHWTSPERVSAALDAAGIKLVSGRCEQLPRALGRVAVCGTEAPWGPELDATLDRTALNLVLSHTPDNVYRLAEQGASVVFAGHTHGGQIRLPGLGAVVVPSRYGRRFDEGHFRVENTDLFVTAGVGADKPPVRVYCPPEILVIDITRAGLAAVTVPQTPSR